MNTWIGCTKKHRTINVREMITSKVRRLKKKIKRLTLRNCWTEGTRWTELRGRDVRPTRMGTSGVVILQVVWTEAANVRARRNGLGYAYNIPYHMVGKAPVVTFGPAPRA